MRTCPTRGAQTQPSQMRQRPGMGDQTAGALQNEITLEGISFSYPDGEKLFDSFSACIRANVITGIVGQSGRGKTTLIDLIAGLQKPSAGRILIDGMPLVGELLPEWKAGLGYLPQDPFFIDGTLRENLVWDSGADISDEEVWRHWNRSMQPT